MSVDPVEAYIVRLLSSLRGMSPAERADISEEIESHIRDRVAEGALDIAEVLRRLGPPEELARQYTTGVLLRRATTSLSPWLILRGTFRWALAGVQGLGVFLAAVVGYSLGVGFLLCGLLKPVFPDETGFWIGPGVFDLGFRPGNAPGPPAREILGPWFIPIAMGAGALILIGTTVGVRALIRRFKRWRKDVSVVITDSPACR